MATLCPYPKLQFFADNGKLFTGGFLYSYTGGTSTSKATYTTQVGDVENANPVVLDAAGRATVFLGTGAYKLVLKTAAGTTVWTVDNMYGSYPGTGNTGSVNLAGTPYYLSMFDTTGTTVVDSIMKTQAPNVDVFFPSSTTSGYMNLRNANASDGSAARKSALKFWGTQSGAETSALGQIDFCHYGTSDDEKGIMELSVNDGNDGTAPSLLAIFSHDLIGLYQNTVSKLYCDSTDTIMNSGGVDVNFTVRGGTDDNLLVCDAGLDRVSVGAVADSGAKMQITSTSLTQLSLQYSDSYRCDMKVDSAGLLTVTCNNSTTVMTLSSAGTVAVSGDIYQEAYLDYSGTSTIVGWSAKTAVIAYKKIGKTVVCQFDISGTSDTTVTTFTLPASCTRKTASPTPANACGIRDAGTGDIGVAYIESGSTVTLVPDFSTAWTASGTKEVKGTLVYEANA